MKEQIEHIFNNFTKQYESAPLLPKKGGGEIKEFNKEKYSVIRMCEDGFPDEIKKVLSLSDDFVAQGSAGQGGWTFTPWIAVRSVKETNSIMKGVYIVYLFDKKCENVYLTLNQGGTELKDSFSVNKLENAGRVLIENAIKIREILNIDPSPFKNGNDFELDNEHPKDEKPFLYKNGSIYFKKYSKGNLPSEEDLISDLKKMFEIYNTYLNTTISYDKFFSLENIPNLTSNITLKTYLGFRLVLDGAPVISGNNSEKEEKNEDANNIILYGPPGTGKTFKMQKEYIKDKPKEDCFVTTFHQSFSYEEFVEGLKPVLYKNRQGQSTEVEYEIQKGVFYKACERAAQLAGYDSLEKCILANDKKQKMAEALKDKKIVFLCIDEINRANVSAVFGDLISLIEPSKRIEKDNEMIVQLPYSKERFGVPANLKIIGTMNTADRSIQLLDSALRRRFLFEELLPDYTEIQNTTAKSILQKINARIRSLLDKDHQIGHSYFIETKTNLDIFNALKDCVIPLLEEYFYNDAQKIRQILNETSESGTNFYIKDFDAMSELDNMQNDYDNEKELFVLNPAVTKVKDDETAKLFINHIASIPE